MKKNITIAAVESFTGGLFSAKIVEMPGCSKYFKGSIVTYQNEIKEKLGVDTSKGVINKECTRDMALKGKKFFNVDYCFAFSGNAGPDAMENKEVGQIYVALNDKVYDFVIKNANRNQVREYAVKFALKLLDQLINE